VLTLRVADLRYMPSFKGFGRNVDVGELLNKSKILAW